MSCETNFHAYCERIAGVGSEVAAAFGGDPQQAQAVLQQIFQIARNQEPPSGAASGTAARLAELQAQAQSRQAQDDTRRLFDDIRAAGLKPPTHSATGLPKPDAQRGYAAVYQTLRAIANGTPVPALAQQVAQAGRVPVAAPPAALAQARPVGGAGTLAQAQQPNAVAPGSPEFFVPHLQDIQAAFFQCHQMREKARDPALHARCIRALQEAPSLLDLANGTQAYGGLQVQVEKAAMDALAHDSVAATFGNIAASYRHRSKMPVTQQ